MTKDIVKMPFKKPRLLRMSKTCFRQPGILVDETISELRVRPPPAHMAGIDTQGYRTHRAADAFILKIKKPPMKGRK